MLLYINRWVFQNLPLESLLASGLLQSLHRQSVVFASDQFHLPFSLPRKKPLLVAHLLLPRFHGSLLLNFDRVLTASSVALFASQPESQHERQFDVEIHDWVKTDEDKTPLDSNRPESGWITKKTPQRYPILPGMYRPIGRQRSEK